MEMYIFFIIYNFWWYFLFVFIFFVFIYVEMSLNETNIFMHAL